MKYPFLKATLFYGEQKGIPVEKSDALPFADFDTDNIDESIYTAMSMMSNAAGGFPCEGAAVVIDEALGSVFLRGNGWSIKWGSDDKIGREAGEPIESWLSRVEDHFIQQHHHRVPYSVLAHAHSGGWNDAKRRPASARVA